MNNDYRTRFAEYEKNFKDEAQNHPYMILDELGDGLAIIERLLAVASKATDPSVSIIYKEALNEAAGQYAERMIAIDRFADDSRQYQIDKEAEAVRSRFMGGG